VSADGNANASRNTAGAGPRVEPWQRSARDRLLAAFGALCAHGITVVGGFCDDPETARAAIALRLREWDQAEAGSYVFWTSSQESCFGADGALRRTLTLYVSGPAVARAVLAALAAEGLCGVSGRDGSVGVLPTSVDGPCPN
jgi:hypothetical protein